MFINSKTVYCAMTGNVVFDRFVDTLSRDPRYMYGSYAEVVLDTESISAFPCLFKFFPTKKWQGWDEAQASVGIQVDSSNFGFLYRGITGPDHLRRGRLGGHSVNTDVPDAARSPPMEVFIEEYNSAGKLTGGFQGSSTDGIYLSRNPLVALGEDKSGPYATPEGMILVIDPTNLVVTETERKQLDEVTCKDVPTQNIRMVYVNETTVAAAKRIGADVCVHDETSLHSYRRALFQRVIMETARDPTRLMDARYPTEEAQARIAQGMAHYGALADRINALHGHEFKGSPSGAVLWLDAQFDMTTGEINNHRLRTFDVGIFKERMMGYEIGRAHV